MAETPDRTYTHDDVIQALVMALEFGEMGIAACAQDVEQASKTGEHCKWGTSDRFGAVLWPGAGCIVHSSLEAMGLLAEAEAQREGRCVGVRHHALTHYEREGRCVGVRHHVLTHYDLRRGEVQS